MPTIGSRSSWTDGFLPTTSFLAFTERGSASQACRRSEEFFLSVCLKEILLRPVSLFFSNEAALFAPYASQRAPGVCRFLKGVVQSAMMILALFSLPHVVSNLYDFLLWNTNGDIARNVFVVRTVDVNGVHVFFGYDHSSEYLLMHFAEEIKSYMVWNNMKVKRSWNHFRVNHPFKIWAIVMYSVKKYVAP